MEDVKLTIRGLKNKKSPGQDGIPRDFDKWWQTPGNGAFPHIHEMLE